jgi:hypothetical protein
MPPLARGLAEQRAAAREKRGFHMSDPVAALVLDLLEWIGPEARPYPEVMDAWRTSCPRLPVWEEATARGFLTRGHREGVGAVVSVSPAGLAHLAEQRPRAPAGAHGEQP